MPIGTRVQFEVQTDERNGKLRAIMVAVLSGHAVSTHEAAQALFARSG